MYTRLPQVWPISEKDLRILKGLRPGKREGQTSQEVHRSWLSVSTSQPILCLTSLIMHTSQTSLEILHRERGKEAGFYTLSCLNNDVGATNRGAHYSPWSFGSWPAASLVKAPVSNDPCQRLPHTAVMTYHTSSLRPHTDNYNHIYSFCYWISPLLWQIDMVMRDAAVGEGAGEWNREGGQEQGNMSKHSNEGWLKTPSEELQYQCSLHRVSFFTQVIVHSPPCPLKSHILPCLAKEHSLSVWALSLHSCFLQWGVLSCHTRCVKPFPLWWS